MIKAVVVGRDYFLILKRILVMGVTQPIYFNEYVSCFIYLLQNLQQPKSLFFLHLQKKHYECIFSSLFSILSSI